MKYFTLKPPPQLQQYVRSFWVLEHEVSANKPYVHRTMADGCAEIVFHYKGRFVEIQSDDKREVSFSSGVHGQAQNFRRFVIGENFGIFGVYLFPFAIPALFSLPANELSDQMPDLQTLLGQAGKILEEKMMLAKDNPERVEIISAFLISRLRKSQMREPAVFSAINEVIKNHGLTTVSKLADLSCLSTRQFERKFKAFSGFSPKLYLRITRFQAALNAYNNTEKSLTEIAYECGYYDQSHFIHDFKSFSGQHPRFYVSGKGEGAEYREV